MKFFRGFSSELYYRRVRITASRSKRRRLKVPVTDRVVIVKFDGIGDFVLFLSAAQAIREIYRDKELVLLCSQPASQIASLTEIFDRVEVVRKAELSPNNLRKTAEKLRQFDCDLLLHIAVSRGIHSEMTAALVRARRKITVEFEMPVSQAKLRGLLKGYDEVIPIDKNAMSLEHNAAIVRYLGNGGFQPSVYRLSAPKEMSLPVPQKYFILFLGASAPWKQYPIERFKEIAKKVCADTGLPCVLAGDYKDGIDVGKFFNDFGYEGYSYVGKTSLVQLVALIAGAQFVIGNDTSAIHIAASCGVKSLCVSSAVSADRFYPYIAGENTPVVVRHTPPCRGCSFDLKSNMQCVGGICGCRELPLCFSQVTKDEILQKLHNLY